MSTEEEGNNFEIDPFLERSYEDRQFVRFTHKDPSKIIRRALRRALIKRGFKHQIPVYNVFLTLQNIINGYDGLDVKTLLPARPLPWQVSSHFGLPPGHPRSKVLYVAHPADPERYIPAADFHRRVFEHKFLEAVELLMSLGAKTLHVEHKYGWNDTFAASISAPIPQAQANAEASVSRTEKVSRDLLYHAELDGHDEPSIPDNLTWLPHEPTWQGVVDGRMRYGLKDFSLKVSYTDDYGVNADLAIDVQNAGLSLGGSFEKHKKLSGLSRARSANRPLVDVWYFCEMACHFCK